MKRTSILDAGRSILGIIPDEGPPSVGTKGTSLVSNENDSYPPLGVLASCALDEPQA